MRVRLPVVLLILALAGCGSNETPTSPSGPQSQTFSGSASITATGGCSSPGHTISAGDGQITITVTQATSPAIALQVCHPAATDHARDCTIAPFARVNTGQSVSAQLRGGRAQTVTIFPASCGTPAAVAETVTYTITVTFPG